MANKTASAKTTKKTKKSTNKRAPQTAVQGRSAPTNPRAAGKPGRLYIIFAIATLSFAVLSIYLLFFANDIFEKYDKLNRTCRSNNGSQVIDTEDPDPVDE